MTCTSIGRQYADGPFTWCDHADVHPQPCLCAMPPLSSKSSCGCFAPDGLGIACTGSHSPYCSEVYPDTGSTGCYWPTDDMPVDETP